MGSFGQRLREIRNKSSMTQKEFAKIFKLSESAIGMYERDEREPSFKLVNEISDHFDVTIDFLLGKSDVPSRNKESELDEFEEFLNNPEHGVFFKEYLEAPEERKKELMQFWRIIKEAEKGRKLGDRQGE